MTRAWISNWPPLSPTAFLRRPQSELPFPLAESNAQLYACGRHALWRGTRALGLGDKDAVLCPAYHAGPEVEVLLRLGIEVRFYGGTSALEPDPDELDGLMGANVRALHLTHYLGFPQDALRWRRWCDDRGLLLIEDAAQSWLGELEGRPLGSFGDLGVTNPYKMLPVPNGAYAICRERLEPPSGRRPWGLDRDWEPLDQSDGVAHKLAAWGAVQIGAIGVARRRFRGGRQVAFDPLAHSELGDVDERPARASVFLLPRVASHEVRAARRANYARLLEELSEHVLPPFATLPPGACPWFFPVRTPSPRRAIEGLLRHRVSTIQYWGSGHPACDEARFPGIAARRATTLALPVHQDLRARDLERIIAATTDVLPRLASA